ncbi:asparagine synthase (glutamine-hydrolyzing) [Aquisediminimonas profunda]|uniref:asparagine synthase (glutamine-hydrolyzing) n=1 Tax=Aquisediminimonas profunda TaxID=1550733 RepID=UPI001C6287D8|nr:asparagine synthase (glutamine-hydrolyzing) [Aquisediminimonas profunda]
MCGIFGVQYFSQDRIPNETLLRQSVALLHHRGPDAQIVSAMPGLGLAHARLSFLDTHERSHQPMWDSTRRFAILFNGEIYNFKEIRQELENKGHHFVTNSDTEVLLQALIAFPPEQILRRLNGMFGLAFFDTQQRTILLARDRFGMKPLFFHASGEFFAVSSEVKALAPWVSPRPDKFMLASYLLKFGGPTKGQSFYQDVDSLAPGEMMKVSASGHIEREPFFQLTDFIDEDYGTALAAMSKNQTVDEMDRLLTESVNSHMFADVPVGAFCSGGVDSSLLMAKAAVRYQNLAIFHANVKGQWSEHHAAVELADHLKLDLISVDVVDQDFVDLLPRVMKHYEYPFTYHPNCAPLMMVACLARDNGVKGLLSGEGSDECFLGYPWLGRRSITERYERLVARTRGIVHRIPEFGQILWPDEDNNVGPARALLNRFEIEDDIALVQSSRILPSGKTLPPQSLWTLEYLHHHLRTLLHRNDTMGMAASIEARFPFLDLDVVRMAVNLDPKYKLRFSHRALDKAHPFIQDKWIVREVAARYLPRSLSHRKKLGFWTTVFKRIDIDPRYFDQSFARDIFRLSTAQFDSLLSQGGNDLAVRLLHIDVWGETCFQDKDEDAAISKLRQYVSIRPER